MKQRKSRPLADRLWEKIDKQGPNDCWLWLGGTAAKGYGTIRKWEQNVWKSAYAHREVLRLTVGDPPSPAAHALHSCDTPRCCNPAHLSWGSNTKNRREARDRLNNQGNQKLTASQVAAIRKDQRTQAVIAQEYSVHLDTVARIKQGRSWLPANDSH